jgi:hypothetical protein
MAIEKGPHCLIQTCKSDQRFRCVFLRGREHGQSRLPIAPKLPPKLQTVRLNCAGNPTRATAQRGTYMCAAALMTHPLSSCDKALGAVLCCVATSHSRPPRTLLRPPKERIGTVSGGRGATAFTQEALPSPQALPALESTGGPTPACAARGVRLLLLLHCSTRRASPAARRP